MTEKFVARVFIVGSVLLIVGLFVITIDPIFWDGTVPDIYRVVTFFGGLWIAEALMFLTKD